MINKDKVSKKVEKVGLNKETFNILPEMQELGIYNIVLEAKNFKD